MLRFNNVICWLVAGLLFSFSLTAFSDAFQGQIVGLDCAKHGHLCPVRQFEQHISQESAFALLTADKKFYTLSNIGRDTLVRHVNKKVIISGTLQPDDHSIKVQQLQVQLGHGLSRYESVWKAP